jgi:branched-chain amino acid transport system substrate-binding protein
VAAETLPPVKIGGLVPLTGALLHEGPKVKRGIDLALEEADWTVAGRKIELVIEDSGTDPTTALDKVRKLVERDKVIAIIGPQHSGVCKAIQPYVNKNKVLNFKSREFPKPLIAKYPYLIVFNGTQQQTCFPMGWYSYEKLGYRTAATMGPDYIAGRAFVGGFMDGFKQKGGKIVQSQWFPVGNVDFAPYLGALKPADTCAAWVAGPGALRLISQYHEYGVSKKIPMIAAYMSGILSEDILPQFGDKALGIYGPSSYASTIENPANKRLVTKYKEKYGTRPGDVLVAGGYMNVFILLEGIKAARGDTDTEKLRKAVLGLRLKDTPMGPIRFTPEGAGIINEYIVKVARVGDDYMWKVVHTYSDVEPR